MQILRSAILLVGFTVCCFGSDIPTRPVASIALTELSSSSRLQLTWASLTFTSGTAIAAGVCYTANADQRCLLSLIRMQGRTLKRVSETSQFGPGVSLHRATGGRVLAVKDLSLTSIYSADLSSKQELPKDLSRFISPSGEIVSEWNNNSWKLYHLTDTLEPLRAGTGDLQAVSDELVLIQDGKTMRVEALDGTPLGSFSAPPGPGGQYASAGALGSHRLYLDDCRDVRVVNFDGKTLLKIRSDKGCSLNDTISSADGRRLLFDFADRRVSPLQHAIDDMRAVTTLGMSGPEDVNRENVEVFDTDNGARCFEWQRSFPMSYSQTRSAAISPSGEFVAIVEGTTLSIYRLAAVCRDSAGGAVE
jgi:hypothetical protein